MNDRVFRLLLLLVCAGTLFAQSTTQQISGFVKDATGAVVTSAKVSVRHVTTDQTRATQANESGFYVVTNLPIGEYEVSAEAPGFKKFLQTNVVVVVNSKPAVDIARAVTTAKRNIPTFMNELSFIFFSFPLKIGFYTQLHLELRVSVGAIHESPLQPGPNPTPEFSPINTIPTECVFPESPP